MHAAPDSFHSHRLQSQDVLEIANAQRFHRRRKSEFRRRVGISSTPKSRDFEVNDNRDSGFWRKKRGIRMVKLVRAFCLPMASPGLCCGSLQGFSKRALFANSGGIAARNLTFQTGHVSLRRHHLYWECGETRAGHDGVMKRNGLSLIIRSAESAKKNESGSTEDKRATRARDKVARGTADLRGKISDFLEHKSGYSWLLGPMVSTAMLVIPASSMNLADIFQRNYLAGLVATFGLDILFVISTDLFLVLTNKLGHHNRVAGGPPPWIGPWEFTGYPQGYPDVLNSVSYAAVGVAALATITSFFTGKLLAAVAVLAPYLTLIFVQVAYERLMTSEKSPVSPLVPIVYTVYRFWQLARALLLIPTSLNGGAMLSRLILLSSTLWVAYLASYLTQLPWLYSTWNSNRAT